MSTSDTRTTTDHEQIRSWAEEHDAVPASVRGTGDGQLGVLTLDMVGHGAGEEELEHVSWDDWFSAFEDNDLAFVYQERKSSGEDSTFFRLIDREGADVD